MTIAIGAYFIDGLIVCADTNIVSTDGTVTSGGKIRGVECSNGTYVIANAANDGNAGNMLAGDILEALAKCPDK